MAARGVLVGVDVGGTFTDLVAVVDGELRQHKLPSSPPDYAAALLAGLAALGLAPDLVTHGTTVATNALLERRGARCGLITTAGFRDVLEIGRQDRPELYALEPRRPDPLIPRERRFEVGERVTADGTVLAPLDEGEAAAAIDALLAAGGESLAVCLLFGFARPAHEQRIGALARERGLHVSLACEVLPEFREYERTSTTVVNAYVAPLVGRYLDALASRLGGTPLRVMQSNGGVIDAATAGAEAVRTVLSGPAAGLVGALEVGRAAGCERLVTFDMGGTSTDVATLDGGLPTGRESLIAGLPIGVPMLDIHTVGAGGGSRAWRDAGGALAVGPQSAGARPGPACYGRGGTLATVTDAHLVLGRLPEERFAGGTIRLERAAAEAAVDRLAAELNLDRRACAEGIVAVANSAMERALRVVTVERGLDPRGLTLLAFGGAGGLHAAELAAALGIRRVLVPAAAGALSALGLLLADAVRDGARTVMQPLEAASPAQLRAWFEALAADHRPYLEQPGVESIAVEPSLDLRYRGQSFELRRPCGKLDPAAIAADFHAAHEQRYGYRRDDAAIELVTVRVRLVGRVTRPELPRWRPSGGPAHRGSRPCRMAGAERAELIDWPAVAVGARIDGPAVIAGDACTVLVPPGTAAEVDPFGNLRLELPG